MGEEIKKKLSICTEKTFWNDNNCPIYCVYIQVYP